MAEAGSPALNELTALVEVARRETNSNQSLAADPAASAWVSANAGAGKTYVLTQRVLRLLLCGAAPERLLCLTYTKTAAAEMRKRVFETLAEWVIAQPEELANRLTKLLERAPRDEETGRARTLFATAIETPGGLKVQTIHAFCEQLLQRFPLEAGIAPHFSILDEEGQAALRRECINAVLATATDARGASLELKSALGVAIAYVTDERFDLVLGELLAKREAMRSAIRAATGEDPIVEIERTLREHFGVRHSIQPGELDDACSAVVDDATLVRAIDVMSTGGKRDVSLVDRLRAARNAAASDVRQAALAEFFITKAKQTPRANLMTKSLGEAHPDLLERLKQAQEEFCALRQERLGLDIALASIALLQLGDATMEHYVRAKAERAVLDYDDLIEKAVGLLTGGGDAQWVLFKLDQGLDHILVDEAQDTSPQQWRVIQDLAEEFFVGAGARDESRSIFAVGDEKQSIYSFQGARPEMFSRVGAHFASRVENAGQRFHRIPLTLSFRTVAPVLDAVDTVFATHERTPGVGVGGQQIRHVANRLGEGGLVELWPTETWAEAEEIELWRPVEGGRPPTPAQRVAENIAGTIRHWLDDGEQLVAEGRAVRPGDVLILVRRRAPFASLMIRALKTRGISVAGADRMRLTEQLAILDLMALGDFLLMPEDDLALGAVLKCPLFGLDDDDLFTLAHDRKGSLWQALLAHRDDDARYQAAVERLEKLRARADFAPPFEFYSLLLGSDGGRQAILARLGPEAGDALDEFLNLAIRYEEEAPPSLQGFSNWLRVTNPEIRRDMDQSSDQVRVMTVHGAKGLEAPIVFLPDTCSGATGGLQATVLALEETLEVLPPVWAIKGAGRHPVVCDARGAIALRDREEYHRLLYVAMTRARDRLYIAGFEGRRGRGRDCWYDLASEALTPELESVTLADGREVLRLEAKQTAAAKRVELDLGDRPMSEPLPEWVSRRAKVEKTRAIPMAPSRLMPLDGADAAVQNEERSLSPLALAGDARFARGLITHALLQHLPELPPERWQTAAAAFVALKGQGLSEHARREIVTETLAILEDPQFGFLFGPDSVAEVPLTAELVPTKSGMPVRVSGQIDRLVVGDDQVVIVDYKTNRPPPADVEGIPRTYLLQLSAYRLALARIYPNHDLRTVLLWTCGPRIMEVPQARLQGVESDLWSSSHGLDA